MSEETQKNTSNTSILVNTTQNSIGNPGTSNLQGNQTNVNTVLIGNSTSSQHDNPSTYQVPQTTKEAQDPQPNPQMPGSLPSKVSSHSSNYVYNPAYSTRQAQNDGNKTLITVFVILGVILILCLCSAVCCLILTLSLDTTNTVDSSNTSMTKSETTPTPQSNSFSATPTPKSQPPLQSTYKVGEKIIIDGIEITVEEVRDDVIANFPTEGKKYIAVLVYVKNDDTRYASVSGYDFKLRTRDDALYSPSLLEKIEPALSFANLDPNTAVRGWVTYEIPVESKGLILMYTSKKGTTAINVDLGL
jgi:hypothetical protein